MVEKSEKSLTVAALLIDILSTYVVVKRIAVRVKALRSMRTANQRDLHLVS